MAACRRFTSSPNNPRPMLHGPHSARTPPCAATIAARSSSVIPNVRQVAGSVSLCVARLAVGRETVSSATIRVPLIMWSHQLTARAVLVTGWHVAGGSNGLAQSRTLAPADRCAATRSARLAIELQTVRQRRVVTEVSDRLLDLAVRTALE